MNNIRQLPNNTFLVRVTKQVGGTRKSKKKICATKREAVVAEEELTAALVRELSGEKPDNLKTLSEEWLELLETSKLRPLTIRKHQINLSRIWHYSPWLATVELSALRPSHLQRMMIDLREANLAQSTMKGYRDTMCKCLRKVWHLREGLTIPFSIPNDVASLKETKRKEILTADEMARFLSSVHVVSFDNSVLLCILATTGLRFSEASALLLEDVKDNTITVNKSQVNGSVGKTKTKAGERRYPIPQWLSEMIAKIPEYQAEEDVFNPDNILFPNRDGNYRIPCSLDNSIKTVLIQAGIQKHITTHSFRHSVNTLLINAKVPDTIVRSLMGHSAMAKEMTDRYYHGNIEEHRKAFDSVIPKVIPENAIKAQILKAA